VQTVAEYLEVVPYSLAIIVITAIHGANVISEPCYSVAFVT